jgi:hypothetical protein
MSNWLAYAGAILTGLVPPLVMYLIGSQKKVLGYAITTNEPAITLRHPDLDGRLSLTLDGKTLNGGQIMGLVIQNLGMKDIEDQPVHLTFPAGVTVLHAHCFSSTLAIGPKVESLRQDSHEVRIPLMNPGDKVSIGLLTTGNEAGRILVTAKGPSLKFKRFDPNTFISPAVNRGLLVMSGVIFAWIVWACVGTDRFMARPFWDKTITMVLISLFLALPSAILAYQGTIPLLKRALQRKAGDTVGRIVSSSQLLS